MKKGKPKPRLAQHRHMNDRPQRKKRAAKPKPAQAEQGGSQLSAVSPGLAPPPMADTRPIHITEDGAWEQYRVYVHNRKPKDPDYTFYEYLRALGVKIVGAKAEVRTEPMPPAATPTALFPNRYPDYAEVRETDSRVTQGLHCTWWGRVDQTVVGADELNVCPVCKQHTGDAFPEDTFWESIDRYELGAYMAAGEQAKAHPGYRMLIKWLQGKCFGNLRTAANLYATETGERVIL